MNNDQNNLNGAVLGNVGNNPTPNPMPAPEVNSVNQTSAVDSGNVVLGSTTTPESQVVTPNPEPNPNEVVTPPASSEVMVGPVQEVQVEPQNTVMTGNTVVTPESQVVTPNPTPAAPVETAEAAVNPNGAIPVEPANQVATPTPAPQPSAPTDANALNTGSGVPNPQVNYTNPQNINPAPMPGFEGQGTVGTTPPISLEKEKKPKKPVNKTMFVIIILALLVVVGFGTYYVLNYTDLLQKKATIKIDTKNFEVNLGENLPEDINSYATITGTNTQNCERITNEVDVTKAGTYKFTIKCGDTTKTGTVTIVDNTELAVNPVTVYKATSDTTIEAVEFRGVGEDNLTYEFVNKDEVINNLKTIGTYTVALTVTDVNGKSTEVNGTLIVLEFPLKGELVCSSNSQTVTGTNASMIFTGRYGIANTTGNPFGKVAKETYVFTYTDETEFNDAINKLTTDGNVTINNIEATMTNTIIDSNDKTLTVTNDVSENEINTKYGNNNFQSYSTIKSYFETTLGYSCTYEQK